MIEQAEKLHVVTAPLLSVNEPESQVAAVSVTLGQWVEQGTVLCTLSTTKANFDVEAECAGFVYAIEIEPGQMVTAGAPMIRLSQSAREVAGASTVVSVQAVEEPLPAGLRITNRALRLAREQGVDLAALPREVLVTEAIVRERIDSRPALAVPFDAGSLVVYGAGGHAKTVIDLVRQCGQFLVAGIVADPRPTEDSLLGAPVLGTSDTLPALLDQGLRLAVNAVGAVGNPQVRVACFERLAAQGYAFPTLIHRTAVIEPSAQVGAGTQVFGLAFVGSAATVGFGVILNTGAIVSHDCRIGDYAHITPGAVLAGQVTVGTGALIGMGVTTQVGVKIGDWARIGNGARIHGDVPANTVVPAGSVWPLG